MSLKEALQRRIEKGSIKATLDGEVVYLKKGSQLSWLPSVGDWFKEWGQIHPVINEDGTTNWPNLLFGGWRNLAKLLIVLAIIGMVLLQFYDNFHYINYLQESCLQPIIP